MRLASLFWIWVLVSPAWGEPVDNATALRGLEESLSQLIQSNADRATLRDRLIQEQSAAQSEFETTERDIETFRAELDAAALKQAQLAAELDALAASRQLLTGNQPAATPAGRIRFNRDIKPILSNNCFTCHGPDTRERKAGLRLDTEEGSREPLKSGLGAIVPGDRTASELYKRITASDPSDHMPPVSTGKVLKPEEIERIGQWIDEGAAYEPHWAFVPPERAAAPAVQKSDWARNDIDRFVLARLEQDALAPSPETDKRTLLRRVYLDLVGLPPTPEQMSAFLADDRPDAYERVVDELLAGPHYGERWARHWLDQARYADSHGYSIDAPRTMYKYRDWVIEAFNGDKPFDQFVVEQIAGDLLPDAGLDQKVATGFHRNTMINEEGGIDKEEFRIEAVIDRVNTTGTVFLGLTIGCAQCHDHKYDPISTKEYYRLFAFFNNDDEPTIEVSTPEKTALRDQIQSEIQPILAELDAYIEESKAERVTLWEKTVTVDRIRDWPEADRKSILKKPEDRSDGDRTRVLNQFQNDDPGAQAITARLDELKAKLPYIPTAMVLAARPEKRETHLLTAGDFTRPGEVVEPGTLAVLPAPAPSESPTRLDLARWLASPENPLTARVTVNRFWQKFFGRGLVETDDDFGSQGSPPTHPDLLDWLAVEFVESGWKTKHMHRLMVTSATYRQASVHRDDLEEIDPDNKLLARQSRLRLDSEIIRDSALVASGKLDPKIGGYPVFPPQPDGVMKLGQRDREWDTSEGGNRYRRGLYTHFWRMTPYPSLLVFDAPNSMETCTRRTRSNTPLQALTLLNEGAFVELAQELGERIRLVEADVPGRIRQAFEICLGRTPTDRELEIISKVHETTPQVRDGLSDDQIEQARWTAVARVLINLDEFITRE